MATKTPDQDERDPVKNVGDEHWKVQEDRFNAYRQKHGLSSEDAQKAAAKPKERESDDTAGLPPSFRNLEEEAAEDSSQQQAKLKDDVGTQEARGMHGPRYRDHFTGDSSTPTGFRVKMPPRKNLVFIVGTTSLAVSLFFMVLLTPAFALVGLKETMLNKLDDRMQTLEDKRHIRLLNKKLSKNPLTSPGCKIKVKCRFKGMSEREIKKFETRNPGSKINRGGCIIGHCRVLSLEFNDSDGRRKTVTPGQFKNTLKNSREFRSHIVKYNKSTVAHWRDNQFGKLAGKLRLFLGKHTSDRAPPGTGTEEDRQRAQQEREQAAEAERQERLGKEAEFRDKLGKGAGVVGVLCATQALIAASGQLAKVELMLKLIPLAILFVNAADDIKNGTAVGDSGTVNHLSELGEKLVNKDENGETAFDSFGWQYIAYGFMSSNIKHAKQFQMGSQSDRGALGDVAGFSIGGFTVATLLAKMNQYGSGTVCSVLGNPATQAAACVVLAATIVGGGVCLALIAAGGPLAALLLPQLLNALVKTTSVNGLVGGKVTNAVVAGFSALTSLNSKARGAFPLSKTKVLKFDKFSDNAQGQGAWPAKSTALDTNPFDTFSKRLAMNFLPSLSKVSNVATLPSALANASSSGLVAVASTAHARTTIDNEYDQCDDEVYRELNIATDPFCVPQYGLDPSKVLGDNDFNSPDTSYQPLPQASGSFVSSVFQNIFGAPVAAAPIDDTRGVTPDNAYDAETVTAYMCGHSVDDDVSCDLWINDDGEPIDKPQDDDYADFVSKCAENTDPLAIDSPAMCKDPDTTSDPQRFNMYSMYMNDTSVNDQYEDKDANLGGGTPAADTDSTIVAGDVKTLAGRLVDMIAADKITVGHNDFGNDSADRSNPGENLEDLAAGKEANTTQTRRCTGRSANASSPSTSVSAPLLAFLVDLGQNGFSYRINSLVGQCHSGSSNHYQGQAVDFACDGFNTAKADEIGNQHGITRFDGESCPGDGHWHYSTSGN